MRLKIESIKANFEPQRKRILKEMKFDLIFVGNKSSILDIKAKNSFVVMIYHGIGVKSSYYNDLTKNMDLICVESVDRETILKKMNFNAVNTGFPKFDLLKNKKPKNAVIKGIAAKHNKVIAAEVFVIDQINVIIAIPNPVLPINPDIPTFL